eukprot:4533201-Pleurochrysis_carterae.AAC.1
MQITYITSVKQSESSFIHTMYGNSDAKAKNLFYFHFTTQAADQNNYNFLAPPRSSRPAFLVTLCPARRDPPC